jgi:8-amino-7-oxononanoate synthase
MNVGWREFLEQALEDLEKAERRRHKCVTQHVAGHSIARNKQTLVNFGSNDYLGIRSHQAVIAAATDALNCNGVGSGASPAVTGFQADQQRLEQSLSEFYHQPSALVFSSGYAANTATLACLADAEDLILSDDLNHASLIDGCRLSKATKHIYPHNDINYIDQYLTSNRTRHRRVLMVTESIFSMDGDAAPLEELATVAERFDCGLVVDEAHATGIYGDQGSGLIHASNLNDRVLVKLGTLSKAIGCVGGFVCGSQSLTDYVMNLGRSYMFSTALPASVLAAASVAIEVIRSMNAERIALRESAIQLRRSLRDQGWTVLGTDSPIIPIVLGDERAALGLSAKLQQRGLFVPAIRPPTVPIGTSRLRISLSAGHSTEQLSQLTDALRSIMVPPT